MMITTPSVHQCTASALICRRRLLLPPELHQLDLRFLVRDDLLGQPAQLWILAEGQLDPGHVDRGLMMRKHQRDEIRIGIGRRSRRGHCRMHPSHAVHQPFPVGSVSRHALLRV
jgi:hypothetical protein